VQIPEKKVLARYVIGLFVIAILIYFLNPRAIISTLFKANPYYLMLVLPLYPIVMLIYTTRWRLILSRMGAPLPIHMAYQACVGGAFISDITPARLGDLLKPLMLKDRINVNTCLASVIVDHYIDALTASILGTVGLLILPHRWSWYLILVLIFLVTGIIMIFLLWLKREIMLKMVAKIKSERLAKAMLALYDSISAMEGGSDLLAVSVLISMTAWIVHAMRLVIILKALGYNAPVYYLFLLQPLVNMLSSIPVTIAGMGFVEGGMTAVLLQLGVPAHVGLSVALTDRVFSMIFNGLVGGRYAARLI
jgi:glycosyltransferase 2 family protein